MGNPAALGTTDSGTLLVSGAVVDVYGTNYSNLEALTINGFGISSSLAGAVINSSVTPGTYAGLLTLGSSSSIVGGTGTIDISNPETITGPGYNLTLGGAAGGTLRSILGTGSATLTKVDAGAWTLSGANTFSGGTTLNAGTIKEGVDINARSGVYFLRTSLEAKSEDNIWLFYNTIREIEATFRVLKTDLDLRPIYHQKDESTMAHLHLGLLAYWLVNTVRHQLKQKGIHSGWREIVRTMNTQKAVTTLAQNNHEEVIMIRRCSEPNQQVRKLYDALKYKYAPFVKRKSVVHKSEFEKCQFIDKQEFRSD